MNHVIPSHRIDELACKVDALNKRGAKLGMDPVVLVASEPYMLELPDQHGRLSFHSVVRVEFIGSAPTIEGFEFVCFIEHSDAGNLVLEIALARYDAAILELHRLNKQASGCPANRT